MEEYLPLVTVAVVTYNSAKYITDTLDSIKAQTYNKIELVISDDNSGDDTVELCKQWIGNNRDRFTTIQILTSDHNTGTSGNANRAWRASSGIWIKLIGGDDLLVTDAIEQYVNFVSKGIEACFADAIHFSGNKPTNNSIYKQTPLRALFFGKNVSNKTQYSILQKQMIGNGPTFFVKRSLLEKVDGFDERFPLMDDYPLLLRISKSGVKFYNLNKATVMYRCHDDSVSHKKIQDSLLSEMDRRVTVDYRFLYQYEHLTFLWRIFFYYSLRLKLLIFRNGNNKHNIICKLINYVRLLTDPFIWYSRLCNLYDKFLLAINREHNVCDII